MTFDKRIGVLAVKLGKYKNLIEMNGFDSRVQ